MRHANVSVTMDHYVQAITPAKRQAQRGIVSQLFPFVPTLVPDRPEVVEKMVGAIGFEPMTSTV
jgi:hypothetical protein